MTNILILGASGLVGNALLDELNKAYNVYGTFNTKQINFPTEKSFQIDIANTEKIKELLFNINPQIVISCLRGDFNQQLVIHKEISNYLKSTNGLFIFCSTIKVFDNFTTKPHYEYDSPNSKSDYGNYKIKCEEVITDILGRNALILRLPMIWGENSPRLTSLICKLKSNEEMAIPTNLFMNHNTDIFLAKQIHSIIDNNLSGIFHLGSNPISHYDFISTLIFKLGYTNALIKRTSLPEKERHLEILSSRTELSNELTISNEDILNYLSTQLLNKS